VATKRAELRNVARPCRAQVLDLLTAWDAADEPPRRRLLAGIFDRIEVEPFFNGGIDLIAVPTPGWRPFFQRVVHQRETRLELATPTLAR
jgi:hypothetical protein